MDSVPDWGKRCEVKCFFRVKCVLELIAISETFEVFECFWEVERLAMENKTKKLRCFYSGSGLSLYVLGV